MSEARQSILHSPTSLFSMHRRRPTESKSQNSDYGSFCNTPSDTFAATASSNSNNSANTNGTTTAATAAEASAAATTTTATATKTSLHSSLSPSSSEPTDTSTTIAQCVSGGDGGAAAGGPEVGGPDQPDNTEGKMDDDRSVMANVSFFCLIYRFISYLHKSFFLFSTRILINVSHFSVRPLQRPRTAAARTTRSAPTAPDTRGEGRESQTTITTTTIATLSPSTLRTPRARTTAATTTASPRSPWSL